MTTQSRTTGPKTKQQKRQEAEARAATKTLRDKVRRLERQIESLEADLRDLERTFADPDAYMSGIDVAELTKTYESSKRRRSALEQSWSEAMEALEAAESAETEAETEGV